MATVYLAPEFGQSLINDNQEPAISATHAFTRVWAMNATDRVFTQFDPDSDWNAWLTVAVSKDAPLHHIAHEWEARHVGGYLSLGDLYSVVVARSGGSFDVTNPTDNASQWNILRKKNASGAWDSTYYTAPVHSGGGVWTTGTTISCVDTLVQCLADAKSVLQGAGHTVKLLPCLFALGQGDALTTTGGNNFYANMVALRGEIATALGTSSIPWVSMKLAGDALDRDGAASVNAAMDTFAAAYVNTSTIDPALFPEYNAGDTSTYGGIYGTDGVHLARLGCWRTGDAYFKKCVDNGFFGVTI